MAEKEITISELAEEYGVTPAQIREMALLVAQLCKEESITFVEAVRAIIRASDNKDFITSKEVESLGVSRQLLHYWVKQDYIRTRSKGRQSLYSKSDVLRLKGY